MDKQRAQKIIKDTFECSFEIDRFTYFIKNLLNRIDESKAFHAHGYVKEGFRGIIKTYERIGTFNASDDKKVDIIVVYLQKGSSLDHARVTQRNFAGRYLDDRGEKDAGLFAFVSPDEADWRFSLVKMDYKFDKNGKVKEEFTPARRWSFLVGANEKSHTAQSRLVDILADDEHVPTLEKIEKAFDIETVTKEFFLKYRELFLRTKEEMDRVVKKDPKIKTDFEANGVDTVNFAKKLLGQIIFLYFLQKKGWFGVGRDDDWGTGSKHFLRELFEKKHSDCNNFFNDILEPLFYEALRVDRSHVDGYYSRFDCKIPFLNGGLFDPIGNYDWVHTDIILPDSLFSNESRTKEGDIGDGILDIFDRYNFTVKEDEPLEKEVAIDPELLGKSYEKFNAIRPDNFEEYKKALKSGKKGDENKFNKQFGVYYTPREIVHYMCQQSLINYLHTEVIASYLPAEASAQAGARNLKKDIEALIHTGEHVSENEARVISEGRETKTYFHQLPESIRKNAKLIDDKLAQIMVCDPAVGSGAFPVGMMSEIVKTRNVLTPFLSLRGAQGTKQSQFDDNRTPYEFKRRCIEHSLYGVDIDPGAVEIAKLRLWLSLVVDEEDIKNIKPLPNLDYRIMQGNSLISEFMGINFDTEKEKNNENLMFKDETDELIEHFQQKKDEFLNESNVTRKSKLKEEVESLLIEIFETKLKTQKADYFNRLKDIENKYSILPNEKQRDEFIKKDKEKLYEEAGFNLESAEKQLKEFNSGKKIKPFFLWNLYFSEVFHNKGGFDVVIANPPYYQLQYSGFNFQSLKDLYQTYEATGDIYSLFMEKAIQILKSHGVLTFIVSNRFCNTNYGASTRKFLSRYVLQLLLKINIDVFDEANVGTIVLLTKKEPAKDDNSICIYQFEDAKELKQIYDIVKKKSVKTLQQYFKEKQWIFQSNAILRIKEKMDKIGDPFVSLKDIKINRGITTSANNIFIINESLKKKFIKADSKNIEIIKPVLKGAEIKRYTIIRPNNYLIFSYTGIKIENYQEIYAYLKKYKNILSVVYEAKKGQKKWYELRKCSYYADFEKEKLIWTRLSNINTFAISENHEYSVDSTSFATGKNLKYYCAVLNSKVVLFYFKLGSVVWGKDGIKWFGEFFDNIPIPIIPELNQKPFIEIVDKILNITKDENYLQSSQKQTKVKALEAEIDQLVYKLYDLTPEEIKIVEVDAK